MKVILLAVATFLLAAVPALTSAQSGWTNQQIVDEVERNVKGVPHDTTLGTRAVVGCASEFQHYYAVWRRINPARPDAHFVTEMASMISVWSRPLTPQSTPTLPEANRQERQYAQSIQERQAEYREHPDRTMIPDMIIDMEKQRCIRAVASGSLSAPTSGPAGR